jgi:8-oxo-dGTP diphosphatase
MSDTTIVLGAAIVRDFRLFVARRSQPASMSGYWELPGDESDGGDQSSLEHMFTREFGVSISCVDQLLSDRMLGSWLNVDNDSVTADLRVWRCQFPSEATFDIDAGDPRPSGYRYDESQWIAVDDLDAVSPWRDEHRISAGEVADYYLADVVWQDAD